LGLAQVKLSTASGSTSAEMTIEGRPDFGLVRDFLYSRMRGVHDAPPAAAPARAGEGASGSSQALVSALRQVSEDLRAVRAALEKGERGARD
jgi:putative membrane protein